MKMRELEKEGEGLWKIFQTERRLSYEAADGSGMSWSEPDLAAADAAFEKHIRKMTKDGWSESERSRTRRVFKLVNEESRKAWIVWRSGKTVGVQFGKIPKDLFLWSDKSGQTKLKDYPTREKAEAAFEKAIAGKLAEGYVELHARETKKKPKGK